MQIHAASCPCLILQILRNPYLTTTSHKFIKKHSLITPNIHITTTGFTKPTISFPK